MKVFIDTSAFIALLIEKEQFHSKVLDQFKRYQQQRASFFSCDYVVDELLTRIIYDFGSKEASQVIKHLKAAIKEKELTMAYIDESVFSKSLKNFIKFGEHQLSFTDSTIVTLCKEYSFDEVFTLDKGFKKVGLVTSPI